MSPGIPAEGSLPKGAQAFVEQVHAIGAWKGKLPPATSLPAAGARAMSRLVLAHPAIADGARSDTPLALFGPTADPRLEALRSDSIGYLLAGALALGMTGHDLDKLAEPLVFAAVAIDPASLLQRHRLTGGKPFGPPAPVIPEWLDRLDDFLARDCFAGVVDAVLELGTWAGSRSTSDATGISSVSPTSVCGGTSLTISGSGFGASQPADTKVYVPAGNGCREATVTQWSDTKIVVRLPADVGAGCVGFVRGGGATLGEPQRVTGELTNCIGAAAEAWTRGFAKVGKAVIVSCPPCLPGGQNRIQAGGRPLINTFRFTPAHVEPGGQPVLSWSVSNATSLQITRVSGNGPALTLPNPLPAVGSITLAPVAGLAPVHGRYRLSATNPCGPVTADAELEMSRTPQLSVLRIEVVQSIQKVDNSVRLTADRVTAVRVFVGSGISDGFDLGAGPNRVGGLTVSLQAESLDDGSIRDCGSPWPVPASQATSAPNRDSLADSFNFDVPLSACTGAVRFRAFVELRRPGGQPPLSSASGTVDVSFMPKQPQELLPFLITDPSSASPAPTLVDFFFDLNGPGGPAREQPFPRTWTINPALSMTLSGVERLSNGDNWTWLVLRLTTMIFLFPSTPVGGIRSAIVPNDASYPWGGMALPRVGATAPSFIVQAGQPQTCAHELGHAFGYLHVNCGSPAGPYDGNLPFTISDPGIDVPARTLVPAGSNELMTYCSPQWASVEHWERLYDSIPI